jgi:predicted dehydrogenase
MTDRLRWGILATGGIAHAFTNDLKLNGFTVQAVGSRSQGAADAFAEEFDIPNRHSSYEALVADPEVDVIYVSTPHPLHAANARLVLEAGKHVLVEKPFTVNAREAQELATLANERGLLVLEAMWTRYLPHMARIREIIADGTLGEVRTLIADHTQKLSDDPQHRINALELGGGALLDLGIYPVSFSWDLFGAPRTIQSTATFKGTGADAQVANLFGYDGGRVASILSASDTLGPNTAAVLGTLARIEIDRVWYTPTSFRVVAADGTIVEEYHSEVTGRGMHFQAEAVERLVAEGNLRGDLLTIDESVAIMGTLDAIREQIGLRYPGE